VKSFAIIILSNGTFGGAQRRFTNMFFALRGKFPGHAWFIVTQSMRGQLEQIYGSEMLEGVVSIGPGYTPPAVKRVESLNSISAKRLFVLKFLKHTFFYKAYFFYKTRRNQFELFREIDALSKRHKIDRFLAVYTGVLPLYFYFGLKKRPRIVFVNMDSWFSHLTTNPKRDWFRQFDLFNRAHAEADFVDVLSPYILNGLEARGIHIGQDRYRITESSFTDYSRCIVGNKSSFTFVFGARLEKDKNPMIFLEASKQLADEFPDARFIIAGDGRLSDAIKSELSSISKANIQFVGFVAILPELLSDSAVFVSLQTDNNYPSQSVLEAMACGNAIIATDVGDTRMFVNDQNGWLINLGVSPLVESMRYCFKNKDEVIAKGRFAANFVRENFSLDRAVAYYSGIIFPENESNG
jgi:glycosyltransferase involved in cell wall biosynthesis